MNFEAYPESGKLHLRQASSLPPEAVSLSTARAFILFEIC